MRAARPSKPRGGKGEAWAQNGDAEAEAMQQNARQESGGDAIRSEQGWMDGRQLVRATGGARAEEQQSDRRVVR